MRKIYNKIVSIGFVKKLMEIPFFAKILSYEIVTYLFFGVMTTVVNFIIANLFGLIADQDTVLGHIGSITVRWEWVSQFAAWLGAVLFAFVTNKLLVFESKERSAGGVAKEFLSFIGGRVLSYVLFEFGMVELLYRVIGNLNIRKIIAAIFTIIFNYIVSKFVSFRKEEPAAAEKGENNR